MYFGLPMWVMGTCKKKCKKKNTKGNENIEAMFETCILSLWHGDENNSSCYY